MIPTENTAIVLRHADYRDNDRMITLLSPSRGRIDALIRSCRKPKSHNLNAGELFALGDYMLVEKGGRNTVTSVRLIETFYPLRNDYTRLTVGVYLLNLADAAAEPEQEQRELFMLLVHTLSRLTFSDQEWKPLLSGFLLHFSACQGFRPRLSHCVRCGRRLLPDAPRYFDVQEGGTVCPSCRVRQPVITAGEVQFLMRALEGGSSTWVENEGEKAPLSLMRAYVEQRLEKPIHSGKMLQ